MEWRHNIVAENVRIPMIGTALTTEGTNRYCLWMADPKTMQMRRISFDDQGTLGRPSGAAVLYDALMPYTEGYVLARYHAGSGFLVGYTSDHRELWQRAIPDADSPCWSMAAWQEGKFHIFYSSCNPHDAYRQAHIAVLDMTENNSLKSFFTAPDEEFALAQMLISQPERMAACVKSRGAATVFYILDPEGEIMRNGAFSAHPHSRWAVPLCHTQLEDGDILMGGYKEDTPGQRRAWVCRFDADISALNGKVVAGDAAEQAVTAFAPQPDGTILALCPPWKILRLSAKGFPTHVWEVPSMARRNSLTAILPTPGSGCFITGRSFAGKEEALSPAVWLGKLNLNEFTELE